ncbi:hypothetical protein DGG96_14675 [Legionella qingyii]|uniref:Uncharacterized protein n=1 Tax=Legionella qingyii TaxID=2184757 RepID=A0A317TYW5_9GAMM|nr:hypothetical protein [Legionella qingyii]PWY54864.1 hypothetical protein DGG96_14675 [Legionella qingyii]RUR20935.1 hypothetical protein ELY20_14115 [Legionella qingyii]RUR23215.1 hypothetical protein ELY16_13550 [Legionella qingyii]
MQSKSEAEYQIGVCVKDTNQENGPGHVSAMLIKKKEGKTKVYHTSFYPGPFGSILNGMTFGSVPVKGQLAPDHMQDVHEADHVLVTSVPKETFKGAKNGHKKFSKEVQDGRRMYSVFAKDNPIANGINKLALGCKGAQLTIEQHLQKTGSHPPEDMCGIHVFDNNHPEIKKGPRVDNCASSVTHVLRKAGYKDFKNPKIPTFFTSELENHGFVKMEKEDFMKQFGMQHGSSLKK